MLRLLSELLSFIEEIGQFLLILMISSFDSFMTTTKDLASTCLAQMGSYGKGPDLGIAWKLGLLSQDLKSNQKDS